MDVSQRLAHHVTATHFEDLPERVVAVTKQSLLDTVGVILAANTLGEGCLPFVHLAVAEAGKPESTILGYGMKVPAVLAAFANGAMSHALDFEDAHDEALVHCNAATIPAALAVAESLGNVTGKEFLTAIALGGDLVCRLGLALKENLLEHGWYMPPILSAFGATAAAAKLLRLTPEQTLDAFSLTLCQATCSAELTRNSDSVIRSVRDAFAAKAGVLSAYLAREGVTGFRQPFEGERGFFHAYARGRYDPDALTHQLGTRFEGANVSFKPWPSCRGTHSYIEGVLGLRVSETRQGAPDLQEIHLVVSPVNKMLCEPIETKRRPLTAIDAKFSLPFVVATALVRGNVTLADFTTQALQDPAVLEVAGRVRYTVDQGLSLKQTLRGRVEIRTPGGVRSAEVEWPYGHPRHPINQELLVQKFKDCAAHSAERISEPALSRAIAAILNLEEIGDLREVPDSLASK